MLTVHWRGSQTRVKLKSMKIWPQKCEFSKIWLWSLIEFFQVSWLDSNLQWTQMQHCSRLSVDSCHTIVHSGLPKPQKILDQSTQTQKWERLKMVTFFKLDWKSSPKRDLYLQSTYYIQYAYILFNPYDNVSASLGYFPSPMEWHRLWDIPTWKLGRRPRPPNEDKRPALGGKLRAHACAQSEEFFQVPWKKCTLYHAEEGFQVLKKPSASNPSALQWIFHLALQFRGFH